MPGIDDQMYAFLINHRIIQSKAKPPTPQPGGLCIQLQPVAMKCPSLCIFHNSRSLCDEGQETVSQGWSLLVIRVFQVWDGPFVSGGCVGEEDEAACPALIAGQSAERLSTAPRELPAFLQTQLVPESQCSPENKEGEKASLEGPVICCWEMKLEASAGEGAGGTFSFRERGGDAVCQQGEGCCYRK